MKRFLATVSLLLAAAVLTTAAAAPSSAAVLVRTHDATVATASSSTPAKVLPTPGPAVPLYQMHVIASVACAKFTGTISWGGNGSILVPAYIYVDGTVSSSCNSTSYLHLHYNWLGGHYDPRIGLAGPYKSVPVHFAIENELATYGDIYVYVCSNRYGWSCSPDVGPK
jgi:hypothetical protein